MILVGVVSLPGIVGCCSQQSGVPTNVSMATSASGTYDNALVVTGNINGLVEDGSNWADMRVDVSLPAAIFNDTEYVFNGYIRESGATTFQWTLTLVGSVWHPGGAVPTISGTGRTDQDCTRTADGMGTTLNINSEAEAGDMIELLMDADATNSSGTTAAGQLGMTLTFI